MFLFVCHFSTTPCLPVTRTQKLFPWIERGRLGLVCGSGIFTPILFGKLSLVYSWVIQLLLTVLWVWKWSTTGMLSNNTLELLSSFWIWSECKYHVSMSTDIFFLLSCEVCFSHLLNGWYSVASVNCEQLPDTVTYDKHDVGSWTVAGNFTTLCITQVAVLKTNGML